MHIYPNRGRDSFIAAYEIGDDFIIVRFRDKSIYRYSYASTGKKKVEAMKVLARTGVGLLTFINQYVRDKYERRIA